VPKTTKVIGLRKVTEENPSKKKGPFFKEAGKRDAPSSGAL
jgi:hypothetical protein